MIFSHPTGKIFSIFVQTAARDAAMRQFGFTLELAAAENIREGKFGKISRPLVHSPTLKFCQARQSRLFVRTVTA